jgi:hypothetical protein
MNYFSKPLFLIVLLFSISAFSVQHFWRGSTISESEASRRWGTTEFNSSKFKSGDLKARASMTASLIKNEPKYVGKTILEIRELLGPTDGFYFSDVYPTYLIQIGKNHSEETWQLVFLLDKNRKVARIIIHKNCCD